MKQCTFQRDFARGLRITNSAGNIRAVSQTGAVSCDVELERSWTRPVHCLTIWSNKLCSAVITAFTNNITSRNLIQICLDIDFMPPTCPLARRGTHVLRVGKTHRKAIHIRPARNQAWTAPIYPLRSRFRSLTSLCSIASGSTSTHGDVTSRLAERFHNVQHPASANKTYSKAIEVRKVDKSKQP